MTTNWKHQTEAFEFVKDKPGAMLAMDMGTGKTKVVIDVLNYAGHNKILIVCPKSVIGVWPEEFHKHAPDCGITLYPLYGKSVAQKANDLKRTEVRKRYAVIINYESAWRQPLRDYLLRQPWDCIVLDESHRIKKPSGKASWYMKKLSRQAKQVFGLTGTPMPHSFLDIYAQYRAIDPTVYGTSFNSFKRKYGVFGGYGGYQLIGIQNEDELNRLFYSIAYRVGADVLDLPETMHITRTCKLEPTAQIVYNNLRKEFVADVLKGTVTAANALTRLLRLAQATSGFIKTDDGNIASLGDAKYQLMVDTLEDTHPDEPWVIFCRFHQDLDYVHKAAASLNRKSLELSGRKDERTSWQLGYAPILAAQIQAGSLGLNLTRARYCGYYSLGFSLGEYNQSLKRTHRPGQTRPVVYYHWLVDRSVDVQIMRALEKREDIIESILKHIKEGKDEQQNFETLCVPSEAA